MRKQMAGVLCGLLMAAAGVMTAQADDWMLSDNGKHWMYMQSPDEPVKDEWIEDGDKLYYVDSKGYMKTGWVTNKDDAEKYYMGPDGAMAFNTFATDGRYVGPDGTGVEEYDKYRKAIKAELKSSSKTKKSKNNKNAASVPQTQQYFLVADLNRDGYRDLVVMCGEQGPDSLLKVALWDPEEKKMQLAAEFDAPDQGAKSTLYLDPEGEEVWLEMTEPNGNMNLFQLMKGTTLFDNVWSFTMGNDDQGYPRFYMNGSEEDRETWEYYMSKARQERGNTPLSGYLPVTDENIQVQVDLVLDEREIRMWKAE